MSEVPLTISADRQEPSGFRLAATLAFSAALSGLVLASAYQITKPIIDENNARELEAAVFLVVPGSTIMQKLVLREDGQLGILAQDEPVTGQVIYGAYAGEDGGRFLGYAIQSSGPGFQDTIRLLYGYDPRTGRVIGLHVLESRETPGLGDKIWKDDSFVATFRSLTVDPPIVVVKGGRHADNEVDAITGATISSKAVVKIINQGNARWLAQLPPPGQEPPLPVIQPDASAPPEPDPQENAAAPAGEDH